MLWQHWAVPQLCRFNPDQTKSSDGLLRRFEWLAAGEYSEIAKVPLLLAEEPGIKVVRTKNRLHSAYDSAMSGGYRDYQIILEAAGGYLLELQVIPEEMHALKKKLGHKNYTTFRFLREANERALKKGILKGSANEELARCTELHRLSAPLGESPYDLVADSLGDHIYDLTADRLVL
eukprot:gene26385-3729_t